MPYKMKINYFLICSFAFCAILINCSKKDSERQKIIKSVNLQSNNLLDSALNLNPKRNIYVGIRSLDTTGITTKYLKIRKDSAELGLIYVQKLMFEIKQLKHIEDSIHNTYSYEEELQAYVFKMSPYWSEEDCRKLKDGEYWIGMTLDMVVYKRQCRPSGNNISDYGNGKQYQWYFKYGSPSYFYGGDDWIITAYN